MLAPTPMVTSAALDHYLLLKKSQALLIATPSQDPLREVNPPLLPWEWRDWHRFQENLRSINVILPFTVAEVLQDDFWDGLGQVFLSLKGHGLCAAYSLVLVVEAAVEEDFNLYLNLALASWWEESDWPCEIPESDPRYSVLNYQELQQFWPLLRDELDGCQRLDFPWTNLQEAQPIAASFLETLPLFDHEFPLTSLDDLYHRRLNHAHALSNLGSQAFQAHHWDQAIVFYRQALHWNPFVISSWLNLGQAYGQQQNYLPAKACLQVSLSLGTPQASQYNVLGFFHEALGDTQAAAMNYQTAIHMEPQLGDSYCHLGQLLTRLNQITTADEVYREGLGANPWHFGLYLDYGNLLLQNDRLKEAIATYRRGLTLADQSIPLMTNLALGYQRSLSYQDQSLFFQGKVLELQGNIEGAIHHYHHCLSLNPLHQKACLGLIGCYQKQRNLEAIRELVILLFKRFETLKISDLNFLFIQQLLNQLNRQDDYRLSRDLIASSEILKTPALRDLMQRTQLPILYESAEDLWAERQRFLLALEGVIHLDFQEESIAQEASGLITGLIHAFVNYQGQDDRLIQEAYSTIVSRVLRQRYPHVCTPLQRPTLHPHERIRIGYASYYLRLHNGARWALGWFQHHPAQDFERYAYYFGESLDSISHRFREESDQFYHIPQEDFPGVLEWLDRVVEQIIQDDLHILVFPDIGMEVRTILLSKLRLAPIQCTAWGHPVTSGSTSVDYYISSQLMEPSNADRHYREKLILLPNLGLYYPHPPLGTQQKKREDFGLPNDRVIYLCCQSLFKYLPHYDYIFAHIAQELPAAYFVFIETFQLKEKFSKRLDRAFQNVGLRWQDYGQILGKQSWFNYLQLQGCADIYLDTLDWSGGNSTLEAIAAGLPVVTYGGEFMRGRHSYAILQRLGVTETIAQSLDDYGTIALHLGQNPAQRQRLSQTIQQHAHRLFEDPQVPQALNRVFQTLVGRSPLV